MTGRPKRDLKGQVTASGEPFSWEVHREPQWCTADGWRGLTLKVKHVDGQREAHVEFPFREHAHSSPHQKRPKLPAPEIVRAIEAALAAGWDPFSRGKPVQVCIDANVR